MTLTSYDTADLIYNFKRNKKRFDELLNKLREAGFPDREILAAMAASPEMTDRLGASPARTRVKHAGVPHRRTATTLV